MEQCSIWQPLPRALLSPTLRGGDTKENGYHGDMEGRSSQQDSVSREWCLKSKPRLRKTPTVSMDEVVEWKQRASPARIPSQEVVQSRRRQRAQPQAENRPESEGTSRLQMD
jgi:hypothetical protein